MLRIPRFLARVANPGLGRANANVNYKHIRNVTENAPLPLSAPAQRSNNQLRRNFAHDIFRWSRTLPKGLETETTRNRLSDLAGIPGRTAAASAIDPVAPESRVPSFESRVPGRVLDGPRIEHRASSRSLAQSPAHHARPPAKVPPEAPGARPEMLPAHRQGRRRRQAQLERAQLPAVLRPVAPLQDPESGQLPREEDGQRRLPPADRVRILWIGHSASRR